MTYKGIDISSYQTMRGQPDFIQAREQGISFVMVRAGWCGGEGEMHWDPDFHQTLDSASRAGLDTGVYLYSYAMSPQAAQKAAHQTVQALSGHRISYPIALDVEDWKLVKNLNRSQITATVAAFCQEILLHQYYPLYYAYRHFIQNHLDWEKLKDFDLWIAQYTRRNSYQDRCGIWQYTGSGICPGIPGLCGVNLSYRNYPQILSHLRLNRLEPGTSLFSPTPSSLSGSLSVFP